MRTPCVSVIRAAWFKSTCINALEQQHYFTNSEIQIERDYNIVFILLLQGGAFYVNNLPLGLCTICFLDFCGDLSQNLCDHKVAHC